MRESDIEGASVQTASTDELDRHVHDVLKRKNKFRRVMKGVWAFLKTREWGVQLMRLTRTDPILIKPWASVVLSMAVLFIAHSLRSLHRFSSASMGSSSVK